MKLKDRLKQARLEAGLTQTQLAEMTGVTQALIYSLESGRISSTTHIFTIANAVHKNVQWLLTGKDLMGNDWRKIEQIAYREIPLLTDKELIEYARFGKLKNINYRTLPFMNTLIKITENTIACEIKNDAMVYKDNPAASFLPNDTIFAEWGAKPEVMDVVLVRLKDDDVKIRQLIQDGKDYLLKAFNDANYPTIKITDLKCVLGVVTAVQSPPKIVKDSVQEAHKIQRSRRRTR